MALQLACVAVLAFLSQQEGVQTPIVTYVPSETRVAILPVANTSGEKWQALRERQERSANQWLVEQFTKRGFKVVQPGEVAAALSKLKINLKDEEVHNRATILSVAQEVKADVAVFNVITDSRQDGGDVFGGGFGVVQLKSWLLDVKTTTPIFSAKSLAARSSRASTKASDRQVWAVAIALTETFKNFFKPYPHR